MKRNYLIIILALIMIQCKGQNKDNVNHKYTNNLINETSPYLLQHAHNPVNWEAWNPEALAKAKKEDKLIIISVGYAACHWCHVMEHESFEDEVVAQVMNDKFINIKVDREERPDVDKVYMDALQLMTGSGGWPMNIVALPDGRPVWGATYLKKDQWMSALNQLSKLKATNPEKLIAFAENLEKGLQSMMVVEPPKKSQPLAMSDYTPILEGWQKGFDRNFGGMNRAPKFMMPSQLNFLLRYAHGQNDTALQKYIHHTLTKIAYGGVYDQIGGGFSRYAVDIKWHVPHFEKMLYDNGQLVSTYSNAYLISKNPLYKEVVEETLAFIERELMSKEFGFYSSLDADSDNAEGELEEGAFYVWTPQELEKLLGEDFPIFKDYYNINEFGHWEHQNYVLIRNKEKEVIAQAHQITNQELDSKITQWKQLLFKARAKRDFPRLDDKILTSWNALMLNGYIDAFKTFGNQHFLDIALKNANFLIEKQLRPDGGLNHSYKAGKSTINGYLEDYATLSEALINLYEVTLDEKWLFTARDLVNYSFDHFFDDTSKFFFFTSNQDEVIVRRSIEKADNVIPASNSIMARSLFKLSHYFFNPQYQKTAEQMLIRLHDDMMQHGSSYSNWLNLGLDFNAEFYEIAVVGKDAKEKVKALNQVYIPNKIISGDTKASKLPLLEGKFMKDMTMIFVCINNSCKLPVTEVSEALSQIKSE